MARYRDAGVEVAASLCETPAALDPAVSTAAYRIAQEALTNSQRHGAGAVTLTATAAGPLLTVTIANPTTSVRDSGAPRGFGLVGMRERAQSAGGRLDVTDTGLEFRVVATLPIDGGTL